MAHLLADVLATIGLQRAREAAAAVQGQALNVTGLSTPDGNELVGDRPLVADPLGAVLLGLGVRGGLSTCSGLGQRRCRSGPLACAGANGAAASSSQRQETEADSFAVQLRQSKAAPRVASAAAQQRRRRSCVRLRRTFALGVSLRAPVALPLVILLGAHQGLGVICLQSGGQYSAACVYTPTGRWAAERAE